MPAPVQKVLRGRFVSKLVLLVIPVLCACGLLTLNWENGFPSFTVNREKVAEVKQQASERIQEYRHEGQPEHDMQLNPLRSLGSTDKANGFFGAPASQEHNTLLDPSAVEKIAEAPGKFFGGLTHGEAPIQPAEPKNESLFGSGGFSNLEERFQKR